MSVYQNGTQTESTARPANRAERRRMQREAVRVDREQLRMGTIGALTQLGARLAIDHLMQVMEREADALAGAPKGQHCRDRRGIRNGYAPGYVIISNRKVEISRPRVRSLDGKTEFELTSYKQAQDQASLNAAALGLAIRGVSTREHSEIASLVSPTPQGMSAYGFSSSAISRRFVTEASKAVVEINNRQLGSTRYVVLYIDGTEEGGHHALVALGLTELGDKQILGLREGTSENAAVVRELLEDLVARGLPTDRGLFVVMDGGKALSSAVSEVLGKKAVVQRCQVHKRGNVIDKLPESKHASVTRRMTEAYNAKTYAGALKKLDGLATSLQREGYTEAAASLREGMEETLTCLTLSVDSELRKTISNTNPIESAFSIHEACAGRVKRWHHGQQVLNWVAAGLLKAEKAFQRVEVTGALRNLGEILERSIRAGELNTAKAA